VGIAGTNREGEAQVSDIRDESERVRCALTPFSLPPTPAGDAHVMPYQAVSVPGRVGGEFHSGGGFTHPSRNDAPFPLILSETVRKTCTFVCRHPAGAI
jgi:hypothetical protein